MGFKAGIWASKLGIWASGPSGPLPKNKKFPLDNMGKIFFFIKEKKMRNSHWITWEKLFFKKKKIVAKSVRWSAVPIAPM